MNKWKWDRRERKKKPWKNQTGKQWSLINSCMSYIERLPNGRRTTCFCCRCCSRTMFPFHPFFVYLRFICQCAIHFVAKWEEKKSFQIKQNKKQQQQKNDVFAPSHCSTSVSQLLLEWAKKTNKWKTGLHLMEFPCLLHTCAAVYAYAACILTMHTVKLRRVEKRKYGIEWIA